jgi:hypothetical protein
VVLSEGPWRKCQDAVLDDVALAAACRLSLTAVKLGHGAEYVQGGVDLIWAADEA